MLKFIKNIGLCALYLNVVAPFLLLLAVKAVLPMLDAIPGVPEIMGRNGMELSWLGLVWMGCVVCLKTGVIHYLANKVEAKFSDTSLT